MRLVLAPLFAGLLGATASVVAAEPAAPPASTTTATTDPAPAPSHFQPMDVFALQWADAPAVAPDGRRAVYARRFFDLHRDRRRTNLWLMDLVSGESRPLTTGDVDHDGARWSPDGRRIAYVGSTDGRPELRVRWVDEGHEARIAALPDGPGPLAWSPDGRWLAFTLRVPADTPTLAAMPKAPDGAEWAPPVTVIDRLAYRFDGAGTTKPGWTHLFVVPAEGGALRQVTRGNFHVDGAPAWLPGGESLVVASNPAPDADYDPLESDLYRVALADGRMTRLTERDGPDASPVVSPDGRHLAWLGYADRKLGYHNTELSVMALPSGAVRTLAAGLDRSIDDARWDGNRGLVIQYDDRGDTRLAYVPLAGGDPRPLTGEVGGTAMGRPYPGGSFDVAGGRIAYTHGTAYRPADLATLTRDAPRRVLTDLSANLLDRRTLGRVEELTWASSADGLPIQGWLVYPPGFDPQRRYPLLLEIHGGPFENYGPRFAPEIQLYAAQGYLVLYTNPRGSTSYGADFANRIHHNYPSQDYDDLMSGVDAAIARAPVDTDNLFVTGGSGGGVLTAWIVGHTDRFRAAVVAKPVINWYSFALTSDGYPFFAGYWFPGPPWEHAEHYLKRSPISYVGRVTTPTMVITGEDDLRTPLSEAEQYFHALMLRRVPTALVRIPGASHAINRRPSHLIAQVLNTTAWFERHRARD